MRKNFLILLSIFCLIFTIKTYASEIKALKASPEYECLHLDDTELTYSDGTKKIVKKALIINGSLINADIVTKENLTLVPIRLISEEFNYDVHWNPDNRKITIEKGNTTIEMTVDNKSAKVNGTTKTLSVAPTIVNNSTYVPLRFISESFNAEVDYYDESFDPVKLVWGIPNIVIEQMEGIPVKYTQQQALDEFFNKLTKAYENDEINYSASLKKDLITMYGKNIINDKLWFSGGEVVAFKNKDTFKYIGDFSRYYVYSFGAESGDLLFDKYTGDIYYYRGVSMYSSLKSLDFNNKELFYDYLSSYIHQ